MPDFNKITDEVNYYAGHVVGEVKILSRTHVWGSSGTANSIGYVSSTTSESTHFFVQTPDGRQQHVILPGTPGVATGHRVAVAEFRGVVPALANGTTDILLTYRHQTKRALKGRDFRFLHPVLFFGLLLAVVALNWGLAAYLGNSVFPDYEDRYELCLFDDNRDGKLSADESLNYENWEYDGGRVNKCNTHIKEYRESYGKIKDNILSTSLLGVIILVILTLFMRLINKNRIIKNVIAHTSDMVGIKIQGVSRSA